MQRKRTFVDAEKRTPVFEKAVKALEEEATSKKGHPTGAVAEVLVPLIYRQMVESKGLKKSKRSPWIGYLLSPAERKGLKNEHDMSCGVPGVNCDHPELFTKDKVPVWFVFHPYDFGARDAENLLAFCKKYRLTFEIFADSWYYPTRTIAVLVRRRTRRT